jgi:hypothetical protein
MAFALLALLATACEPSRSTAELKEAPLKSVPLPAAAQIATGQTIYVPIYSYIYMWDQNRTMDLTATLSIRNTDRAHPLIVTAVNYYDSRGKLLRSYLEQPVELGVLSSTQFVVNQQDVSGGAGASFVVEWVASTPVSDPVIESVMINTSGNQGLSFVSPGRVVKRREKG